MILPTILQSFNFDAETLSEQIGTGGAGGELDLGSALMTHTRRKQKIEQRIARRVKQQQQQQRQQQQGQQRQPVQAWGNPSGGGFARGGATGGTGGSGR